MRICLLTGTFFPKVGGAEICVDQLARAFVGLGHDVVVVAPRAEGTVDDEGYGYPVYRYRPSWSQRGWYLGLRGLLTRLHQERKFDLLNAHMAYPSGYVGLKWSRKYRVPLVITPHGGGVFYRSRFRGRPVIFGRICESLGGAEAVIALSGYLSGLIAELAPGQKNIVHINNGVNNAEFNIADKSLPEQYGYLGERPYFIGLGRMVGRKGFDTALRALAKVKNAAGELQLVLLGDGNKKAELEGLADELGIGERVHFLGTVVGADKIRLLHNCLFTVVPSVEEDNMPLVLLEAMACGKPVLGSELGGIPDVVQTDYNGYLCESGNAESFAEGVLHIMTNAETLGVKALATAREIDWQKIAEQYIELFKCVSH